MLAQLNKPFKVAFFLITPLFFLILLFLLVNKSMQEFSHDEHQFIASAQLLASQHLLPYKDYLHLHVPNLVFIYAVIFKFTNYLLLSARLFSIFCAFLSLCFIFLIAFKLFYRKSFISRFFIATISVLFIFTNPLFIYTTGFAWNHDFPLLLFLLAFVVHSYALRDNKKTKWIFLSGILVGLAVGSRLSFIFAVIPFIAIIFLNPNQAEKNKNLHLFYLFILGFLLSTAHLFLMFISAPKQFIFCHLINSLGFFKRKILLSKFTNLKDNAILNPANFTLFFAFVYLIIMVGMRGFKRIEYQLETKFLLILIPFLFMGSFIPRILFPQYFYQIIPFLLLGILYCLASLQEQNYSNRWALKIFLILTISVIFYEFITQSSLRKIVSFNEWFPVQAHEIGVEIKTALGKGKVLTLAPIFPLEGELDIYPEFAAGPFIWRLANRAPLLYKKMRKDLNIVTKNDLGVLLSADPPKAILVGFEGDLENPFIAYAKEHMYKELKLSNSKTLWVSDR